MWIHERSVELRALHLLSWGPEKTLKRKGYSDTTIPRFRVEKYTMPSCRLIEVSQVSTNKKKHTLLWNSISRPSVFTVQPDGCSCGLPLAVCSVRWGFPTKRRGKYTNFLCNRKIISGFFVLHGQHSTKNYANWVHLKTSDLLCHPVGVLVVIVWLARRGFTPPCGLYVPSGLFQVDSWIKFFRTRCLLCQQQECVHKKSATLVLHLRVEVPSRFELL